ncbi:MAG: Eco57I restriction-modification methylase domain-containing protein [Planctomycetes bacterium]|nr:Eco57I restriction-modification methylase domain-containing protein [Planctomycetota bacterium]
MLQDDRNLTEHDVMGIKDREALVRFIAHLGYTTDARQPQTPDTLSIGQDALKRAIKHVERIAADGDLQVFLFELSSLTLGHRRSIVNQFNNKMGDFLFVLTTPEYERLDFVLLERFRKEAGDEDTGPTPSHPRARPLAVSVERRKPSKEALRALRRMTFTCADGFDQHEKLVSVFRVAQWSEPRYNNVALFSDHYLNHRLPDEPEWQDTDGVKTAYKAIRAVGDHNKTEQRKDVDDTVIQVLKLMGHKPEAAKAHDDGPMLKLSENVVCFAYPWNRALDTKDDKDPTRPDDIPAARVVTQFEKAKTPWVILTNGKQWRLYCERAHARHANFYEADFRETLAAEAADGEAFRYFWLFFRAQAFAPGAQMPDGKPGPTFLDRLFDGSRTYAKELGERLKARVFEQIFPHFAEGFIANIREKEGKDAELSEERLGEVFRATLTMLYRLIFLLYAESRDLLPVNEQHGYGEISLRRLSREIAEKAGINEAQAKDALRTTYSPSETNLYAKLVELFRVIDEGDATRNVPLYNGGLFLTKPAQDDETDEASVARFLAKYKVPDRYLALGLDLLARDEDPKTHKLVPVDFKSLGVRHLGSVYEGLLEFKVRVAAERMALVKDKKGELVVPAREAEKEGLKIATRIQMHGVEDGYLKKGAVYLENDKHERKATGSYYTPDYIVKYIVEHTVGPVLEEKFNALRNDFRKAEAEYHAAKRKDAALKKQMGKGDDPEKVARSYDSLVDKLFTLRVLDPAMGSGHFLVETVDFITDRMLDFLNGFPWNPVQAFIQRTRRDILTALNKAEVTVDPGKLTDINLLKRHVLKRCIFGVDLNPMAVELAKVSLWLDCFTLGAPLSFLDHHLKCGNSLIGVTVEEVEKTLKKAAGMFTSRFAGLMLATNIARQIAAMPDTTAEQAAKSRSEYRRAADALAPFKRLLDIYASQWFGNGLVAGLKGEGKKKDGKIAAIEWLNSDAAEELLRANQDGFVEDKGKDLGAKTQKSMLDNTRQRSIAESSRRKPAITDKVDGKAESWFNNVPKVSSNAAREQRFFHWELEFPEVFYAPTTPGGQAIKRIDGAGFDAVVGNPPYDVLATKEIGLDVGPLVAFFEARQELQGALRGKRNLFKLFICLGVSLTRMSGYMGCIVPMSILGDDHAAGVRETLFTKGSPILVDAFPQKDDANNRVFPEAKLSTAIVVFVRGVVDAEIKVRTHSGAVLEHGAVHLTVLSTQVRRFDPNVLPIPSCLPGDWSLVGRVLGTANLVRLASVAEAFQGEVNETTSGKKGLLSYTKNDGPEVIRGACITLYAIREASQGTPIYVREKKFRAATTESEKADHPLQRRVVWQESSPQNNFKRIIAAILSAGHYCNHTVNYIPESTSRLPLDLLLMFLNSAFMEWFFRLTSSNAHVSQYQIGNLPLPAFPTTGRFNADSEAVRRVQTHLEDFVAAHCQSGMLDEIAVSALMGLSKELQDIESARTLSARSDRSALSTESQRLQKAVDRIVEASLGLTVEDGRYIEERLREML